MNEQKLTQINWLGYKGRKGFTNNPVRGCTHLCEWTMPDGSTAICYAKTTAQGLKRKSNGKLYSKGFENITFHPKALTKMMQRKKPSNIFIDSMSDLLGHLVKEEYIVQTLQAMHDSPQHTYFLLTKNHIALKHYGQHLPSNVWMGISSPPSSMFGKEMDDKKSARWFDIALYNLISNTSNVRWLSLEPLCWTVEQAEIMVEILDAYANKLQWVVVGAASNGATKYQPDKQVFQMVVDTLRKNNVPIFLKNNISPELADEVCGSYLAEYPSDEAVEKATKFNSDELSKGLDLPPTQLPMTPTLYSGLLEPTPLLPDDSVLNVNPNEDVIENLYKAMAIPPELLNGEVELSEQQGYPRRDNLLKYFDEHDDERADITFSATGYKSGEVQYVDLDDLIVYKPDDEDEET